VIHYTANPGSTARQNRDYFAGLAESHETSASSHFVIGLQGEIVQCIPCNEIAYASNERNGDTIAIECCIEDESGKFNSDTYRSLVELTSWLIGRYDLCVEDVIRHYDVTGKNCPKYFVEHENAWEDFKNDIISYIDENGVEKVE
jgi:N-acetylmuramoyl-L-alanine amidase CwlA